MKSNLIKDFVDTWTGRGYEKGEAQPFWLSLLHKVLGVADPEKLINFEDRVILEHGGFIDAYIPSTKVLIEQKGLGRDLRQAVKQSDGALLTPFQQAKRYSDQLPYSQRPRWIVVCNFAEFHIHDMEQPHVEPEVVLLKNLEKEAHRLRFLIDAGDDHIRKELEVSLKAGEIVGKIYDSLLEAYEDKDDPQTLHSLNILCVRLVFCLYAEDSGMFGANTHSMFHDYLKKYAEINPRLALVELFRMLDTKIEDRDKYIDKDLAAFPYVNGGLFGNETIQIPHISPETLRLILKHASEDFNWSDISPTIFGAVFESTLNPETRRKGGMHYTSIENIHKVIDPLFMDDLREEFNALKTTVARGGGKIAKPLMAKLRSFQDKLASLKFLDPACGSGNFLTETFISLRRLENEVVKLMTGGQAFIGLADFSPIKVNIHQFHGIEINDFAATVAKTALWIAESQMLKETESIIDCDLEFLPLKSYANIRVGNALRLDWDEGQLRIKNEELRIKSGESRMVDSPSSSKSVTFDYIMGNPPFVGYSLQSEAQKSDILAIYRDEKGKPYKTAGKIDYVSGWYWKAAELMKGTHTRAALVSTNSITQGEQVASVWKPLCERFGVEIDFAHRTFRWDSEAAIKAHVHCVIVGFSCRSEDKSTERTKIIFDGDNATLAHNINPYLIDAENAFIVSRNKPICDIPEMTTGNRPADGGNLIIEANEYEEFIKKEPGAKKFIKRLIGAEEYINSKLRYCLWLVDATPNEMRSMPLVMKRIEDCRAARLGGAPDRQKLADTPYLFREQLNPEQYVVVPAVSSEKRKYAPIGFLNGDTIPTNLVLIIPSATLYHFGVLTSSVHMAWMRAVCGRLKSDYRYSKDIVYNNFPWPRIGDRVEGLGHRGDGSASPLPSTLSPTPYTLITKTAQAVLDARAQFPEASLADLYDELTMPPELRKAHRENDKAVLDAYGFAHDISEPELVAKLMGLYRGMVEREGE